MYLLVLILTIAVMASPPEMKTSVEVDMEFNFLKLKIENLETSDNDLKKKIDNMKASETNLKEKMEASETYLKKKIENLERNEDELKSQMITMEKKIETLEEKCETRKEQLNDVKVSMHHKTVADKENTFVKTAEEVDAVLTSRTQNSTEDRLKYLEELSKVNMRRNCHELSQYGVNMNNFYYVDPDGPLVGSAPIRVYCDFSIEGMAITEILHNSEEVVAVEHCHDPGCYARHILYSAPDFQIESLIQLSDQCEQSIKYNCLLAPLRKEGVDFGFWLDKHGEPQVYWDGSHSGEHVCGCHFEEEGCLEEDTTNAKCNCDAEYPEMNSDVGTINNMSALPISQLQFGGLNFEIQEASHQLGRLRCWGKADFEAGTSCMAIKKAGEFRSGFYNVKKSEETNSQLVFCNLSSGYDENSNDEVFVESSEDHFQNVEASIAEIQTDITEVRTDISDIGGEISIIQDNVENLMETSQFCSYQKGSWETDNQVITYEKLTLQNTNIPEAEMDINTGKFTAGATGVYQVDVTMIMLSTSTSGTGSNTLHLRLNGADIPESGMYSQVKTSDTSWEMGGRSMMLHLNRGDTVSVYSASINHLQAITFCINLV